MKQPRFSILIPTTGRADLARHAIHSLLKQEGVSDFEIIVADASKVDDVEKLIQEINDSRICYFRTPNADPSVGWDFAYTKSTGDYILWLDDDNYLLPNALKVYDDVIKKTDAEIVTAHHLYYYDDLHPRTDRKYSLGAIIFDGKVYHIPPKEAARSCLQYKQGDREVYYFRWHPAATFFSRAVCERAMKRIGHTVLPHTPVNHSQQPILFGLARSLVGVSIPLVIVGRLGKSETQRRFYGLDGKKPRRIKPFDFQFSPVSGQLTLNYVAEVNLRVRDMLKDEIGDIKFNTAEFLYYRYGNALFFGLLPFKEMHGLWKELVEAVSHLPEEERKVFYPKIKKKRFFAYILFPLKVFGVWGLAKDVYRRLQRLLGRDKRRIPFAAADYIISLKGTGVTNIEELSRRARDMILRDTGRDIASYSF